MLVNKNRINSDSFSRKRFGEDATILRQNALRETWARDDFNKLHSILEEWKRETIEKPSTMTEQLQLLYWDSLALLAHRKLDQALTTIQKSIGIIENTNITKGSRFLAKFYLLEAWIYLKLEQAELGLKSVQKAMTLINQQDSKFLLVEGLTLLAQVELDLRKQDKAQKHFLQALEIISSNDDPYLLKMKALIYRNLGFIYRMRNELEKAITYLKQSISIFESIKNTRQAALTLLELARLHNYMNRHETSLQYLQQAEKIFRTIDDKTSLALTLSDQARILSNLRQFDRAVTKLKEASSCISESLGQTQEWKNHMLIGSMWCRQGKVEQAINHFKEASSISRAMKDKIKEARANYNLACAMFYRGSYRQAKKIAEKVLSTYLEEENIPSSSFALVYQLLGEIFLDGHSMYMTARYYLEKALAHAKTAENIERQVSIKLDLIKIEIRTMNLEKAEKELDVIENVVNGLTPDVVSEFHYTKGLYHDALGQHEQALEQYNLALNLFSQETDPYLQVMILYEMGKCLKHVKHHSKSIETLQQALNIARTLNNRVYLVKIHEELGIAWENLGSLEQASKHWEDALKLHSKDENGIAKLLSIYLRLINLHERLGNYEKMNDLAQEAEQLMTKVRHYMS